MSLWSRLFSRKPQYVPKHGDGSLHGNWAVGDLAVCIEDGWIQHRTGEPENGISFGEVAMVAGVSVLDGYHCLRLEGCWYTAHCFRKAQLANDEACTPDFAKLVKRKAVRA